VFYTYAHYTPEGRLFYIGKGGIERAKSLKGRNIFWRRVVKKHGKPTVQLLARWDTNEEACDHEIVLIQCFRDLGHELCNLTGGGEGSYGVTPWNKGKPWSDEVKKKCGVKNLGNKFWVGKHHTEEAKHKQSIARLTHKYIGTNIKDGSVVELFGKKDINNAGFVSTHVYRCVNGKSKVHKGYTWHKEKLEQL